MKIREGTLFFLGDNYACATWVNETNNETHVAIFRDLQDDGIVNFVITQLAGPWQKRNEDTGLLEYVEFYKDLWWEIQSRAEIICDTINREKDIVWSGDIKRA